MIEEDLKNSEKKLRDITSALGEGVYVLDVERRLAFMNPEAERLLGWTEAELMGRMVHPIIHFQNADGTVMPEEECPVIAAISTGRTFHVHDDVFTRRDGALLPVAYVCTPVLAEGKVVGSVTAFHDITVRKLSQEALKRANEILERQATTDVLTGIPNRIKFNAAFESEISSALRHGVPLTLILFDIDYFKKINDTFGHHIGDVILQELAKVVADGLRFEDIFARWGGEEFVVLLPHTDREGGRIIAERFRRKIEQNQFSVVENITCSFGVAEFTKEDSAAVLMEHADKALYRAKAEGRNRVECHSDA